MDTRVFRKIIKELSQIERREKSIQEAEIQLAVTKDIEQERKSKKERETFWILNGGDPAMNQTQICQYLRERVRTLEEENDLNRAIYEGIDVDRSRMYLQDTVNQLTAINELLVKLERRLNK